MHLYEIYQRVTTLYKVEGHTNTLHLNGLVTISGLPVLLATRNRAFPT